MARPTKLTAAVLKKAHQYYTNKIKSGELPLIEELATSVLNVDEDTVTVWTRNAKNEAWMKTQTPEQRRIVLQFFSTYKKINTLQKMHLKIRGMGKKGTPAMEIFLLKANHGMVETSRTEVTGLDGGPVELQAIQVMGSIKAPEK